MHGILFACMFTETAWLVAMFHVWNQVRRFWPCGFDPHLSLYRDSMARIPMQRSKMPISLITPTLLPSFLILATERSCPAELPGEAAWAAALFVCNLSVSILAFGSTRRCQLQSICQDVFANADKRPQTKPQARRSRHLQATWHQIEDDAIISFT